MAYLSQHRSDSLLPILAAEEFREQVGDDSDLITEIVDLFCADVEQQLPNMKRSLQSGDLLTLSRSAHSIKGSLGSLFAKRAAARAQALESAAKAGDAASSGPALAALETAIQELLPELQRLRQAT